tara:strand:- start:559 stop:813 length:255 start_codon:yes stop_codon:yes gene_type:complete
MKKINKKGLVGGFTVDYVATIMIIVLLVVFILGAAFVKNLSEVDLEVRILNSKSIGIYDAVVYVQDEFLVHVMKRVGTGGIESG